MQSLPEPERETLGQALGLHKISTKEYLLRAKDFEKAAGEHGGAQRRRGHGPARGSAGCYGAGAH